MMRGMRVMIVAGQPDRSALWARHLRRAGAAVSVREEVEEAVADLLAAPQDVVIVDLALEAGGALTLSDVISYRRPDAKVIFISDGRFFSDGSIFAHCANACAFLPGATPPEDIVALAEHHGALAAG